MIKCLIYIIFFILFQNVFSDESKCQGTAKSVSECKDLLEPDDERNGGHCCLFTGKLKADSSEVSECMKLDQEQYEDIENVKTNYEEHYDNPSIKCKSYYLKTSIISLLLFLF